jgi:DNA invertase Pin-like site-specific DNA recombinase
MEKRPGWCEALAAMVTHGAGILLVQKRDRIARDVALAVDATRAVTLRGGRVQSADGLANGTDPSDAMMRTLLDAFAAQERAIIGARTKAALAAKRSRGEAISPPRYGWKRAGDLEIPCDREQATIAAVREARNQGVSFRKLGAWLAERGHVGRSGKPLSLASLHALTVALSNVGQRVQP